MRRKISLKTVIPNYYPNKQLPRYTTEELEALVKICHPGADKTKKQITELLLRLAMSVASVQAAKFPTKKDDIAGAALLALTEGVHMFFRCEEHDLNIRPYVVSKISWDIRRYITQDRLIKIPARSYYYMQSKGAIDALNVRVNTGVQQDLPTLFEDLICTLSPRQSIPINMDSDLDVRDVVSYVIDTDEDERLMELKIIGCSDKEIASDIKKSVSFVRTRRTELAHQIQLQLIATK